jgi:HK97 gp10 family phage protein
VKVTVTGTDKALANLRRLEKEMPGSATRACIEGAEVIADMARAFVPMGSGNLAISIAVQPTRRGAWVRADATKDDDAEYAGHVEYGTSKMRKQPYLRPAVDMGRSKVMRAVDRHIKSEIEKR